MTKLEGGCHCGAIRFTARADFSTAMVCNCSHCAMKDFHLAFVPTDAFNLVRGQGAFTSYRFNTGTLEHTFCSTCGVQAFGYGRGPDGNEQVAINLRCVDGIDLETLSIRHVNGRDH